MKKIFAILFITTFLFAQEKADSLGNNLPLKTTRTISFNTNEGTWMSIDISPEFLQIYPSTVDLNLLCASDPDTPKSSNYNYTF